MRAARIWATTIAQLKMMFRRRVALFWSFVFPIILLTLLGLLFGQSIDAGTITVIDRSHSPQARQMVAVLDRTDGVTVKRSTESVPEEQKRVKDGDSDALLVLTPAGSSQVNATLSYSNASSTQAGIIQGVVSGAADGVAACDGLGARRAVSGDLGGLQPARLPRLPAAGRDRHLDHDLGGDRAVHRAGQLAQAGHPAPPEADADAAVGVPGGADRRVAGTGDCFS